MKNKVLKRLGALALTTAVMTTTLSSAAMAQTTYYSRNNYINYTNYSYKNFGYTNNYYRYYTNYTNYYTLTPTYYPTPTPTTVPTQTPAPAPAPTQTTTAPTTTQTQTPAPTTAPVQNTSTPVAGLTAEEQQMVDLVNAERVKAGLKPLQVDLRLVNVARLKSKDMIDKNYFSHTSPTYGSPFDMMKSFGITYSYAGENLAGNSSVTAAHTSLMNSAGHKANILNVNYTKIGIGIIDGGPYGKMFTQEFIG